MVVKRWFSFVIMQCFCTTLPCYGSSVPGREKKRKKNVRSAVKSRFLIVSLCSFTARFCHISPLTKNYCPYTVLNLSPPACQQLLLPMHLSQNSFIYVSKLNRIWSTFCKTSAINLCRTIGEITNFSVELWWYIVGQPLSLVFKLHKFTTSKNFRKIYDCSGVNFSSVF